MSKKLFVYFLVFAQLALMFAVTGCADYEKDEVTPTVTYTGGSDTAGTNDEGRVDILSTSILDDTEVTYEIHIHDENAQPLTGITVAYEELNGKSLIIVSDNEGEHTSAILFGTPSELEDSDYADQADELGLKEEPQVQLISLAIVLLITVVSIAYAEIQFIMNAYEMQTFLISDFVEEEEDYLFYCKGYDEIADFINNRVSSISNLKSIVVSIVTAGGSNVTRAVEIFARNWVVGTATELIQQVIVEYTGMNADEVVGRNLGFKYYFPGAEANGFAQLYATFEIDPFDERCFGENETVSGVVRDSETNNTIDDVLVQISGTSYSNNTYTNYAW